MITFSYALFFLILNGHFFLPGWPSAIAEKIVYSTGAPLSTVLLFVLYEIQEDNYGIARYFTIDRMEDPPSCGILIIRNNA
jgi:hypothetical protein